MGIKASRHCPVLTTNNSSECFSEKVPSDVIGIVATYCLPAQRWNLRQTSKSFRSKMEESCEEEWDPIIVALPNRTCQVCKYFWAQHALMVVGELETPDLSKSDTDDGYGTLLEKRPMMDFLWGYYHDSTKGVPPSLWADLVRMMLFEDSPNFFYPSRSDKLVLYKKGLLMNRTFSSSREPYLQSSSYNERWGAEVVSRPTPCRDNIEQMIAKVTQKGTSKMFFLHGFLKGDTTLLARQFVGRLVVQKSDVLARNFEPYDGDTCVTNRPIIFSDDEVVKIYSSVSKTLLHGSFCPSSMTTRVSPRNDAAFYPWCKLLLLSKGKKDDGNFLTRAPTVQDKVGRPDSVAKFIALKALLKSQSVASPVKPLILTADEALAIEANSGSPLSSSLKTTFEREEEVILLRLSRVETKIDQWDGKEGDSPSLFRSQMEREMSDIRRESLYQLERLAGAEGKAPSYRAFWARVSKTLTKLNKRLSARSLPPENLLTAPGSRFTQAERFKVRCSGFHRFLVDSGFKEIEDMVQTGGATCASLLPVLSEDKVLAWSTQDWVEHLSAPFLVQTGAKHDNEDTRGLSPPPVLLEKLRQVMEEAGIPGIPLRGHPETGAPILLEPKTVCFNEKKLFKGYRGTSSSAVYSIDQSVLFQLEKLAHSSPTVHEVSDALTSPRKSLRSKAITTPLGTLLPSTLYEKVVSEPQPELRATASKPGVDTPWLIVGTEGAFSSEHVEPNNSHTWAHLLEGSKTWFIKQEGKKKRRAEVSSLDERNDGVDDDSYLTPTTPWTWFKQKAGETVFLPPTTLHVVLHDRCSVGVSRNFFVKSSK